MSVQVMTKFGKVIFLAKSWRQMRQESRISAKKAKSRDNWLLDAQSGASLMSGGSLEKFAVAPAGRFSVGRIDKGYARQPKKSWKSYPNRSGRTIRQWRTV